MWVFTMGICIAISFGAFVWCIALSMKAEKQKKLARAGK